jgi:lipopolysaccharide transport system permease protein
MNIAEKEHNQIIIQSTRGWSSLGLGELWEYRELLVFLVFREIQGIYRQTALGVTWLFLRPLVNVILLTFVFSTIVNVPSDGVPYPLFSLAALIPWGFFSNAVQRASRSLVDNMNVISKVYFPRLVVPISGAASGLFDFAASLVILFGAMLLYKMPLRPQVVWLPFYMLVALAFALGIGLWLATLSVKYRDVTFAIAFLLQALMYASPVIYPVSMVPEPFQTIYQLNPMTGVIQGFRWSLYGSGEPPGFLFFVSIGLTIVGLITGVFIFRRTERTVVDIL